MNTSNLTYSSDQSPDESSARRPAPAVGLSDPSRVTLVELFSIVWAGKWIIFCVTAVFVVLGVVYALSLPSMYTSEGYYTPAKKSNPASPVSGQFGGLAAMAGINLGAGGNNEIDQAMKLMISWPFLESVVSENHLSPEILGVREWDELSRELIFNSDVYDAEQNLWLKSETGDSLEPTSYEVFQALGEMINVNYDATTGLVDISVTHYSPVVAEQWVQLLVTAINEHFQRRDIIDATRNINYLEAKISETRIAEMQQVFYRMIESQMQTLMLAEVGDEYLLKEVVPPKVAERKSKPAKTVICIMFLLIGVSISLFLVLVLGISKKNRG